MPDESGVKKDAPKGPPEPKGVLVDAARAIGSALGTLAARTSELATKLPAQLEQKLAPPKPAPKLASKPGGKKKKPTAAQLKKRSSKARPGARKRAR